MGNQNSAGRAPTGDRPPEEERFAAELARARAEADEAAQAQIARAQAEADQLRAAAMEEAITTQARESTQGRILCFGRWTADFGIPIDWHKNPHNGQRWRADRHWSNSLAGQHAIGDVKVTWEAARFPQAYRIARGAVFQPCGAGELYEAFTAQVQSFVRGNPPEYGIHWNSGQEIAIRLVSWLFALDVFSQLLGEARELSRVVLRWAPEATGHIAKHIEYARESVNNNH